MIILNKGTLSLTHVIYYDPRTKTLKLREDIKLPTCGNMGTLDLKDAYICAKCHKPWDAGYGNDCYDAWQTWLKLNQLLADTNIS
jgi:hypothetical protein